MPKARNFLVKQLYKDAKLLGPVDREIIEKLADAWMDDKRNDLHRYEKIAPYLKSDSKILDMASGCGTFVFLGLKKSYDIYGIDPEKWKLEFNQLKIEDYKYPKEWINRFTLGVGESLPYEDNSFDIVSTYQTLEHVQDIPKCLSEMLRVVKKDGIMHIECPDYRGTFEPHYTVPFLPLFPKKIAKLYLRFIGKNPDYLDSISYTTKPSIIKILQKKSKEKNIQLESIDMHQVNHYKNSDKSYFWSQTKFIISRLFKKELSVHLIVKIKGKGYEVQ